MALDQVGEKGFAVLPRIAKHAEEREIEHRVIFGFTHRTAPKLIEFLRAHGAEMSHLSGVRYASELGHPFHVIDGERVILALDHPFVARH